MLLFDAIRILNQPTKHGRADGSDAATVLLDALHDLGRRRGTRFSPRCREQAHDAVLDAICCRGAHPTKPHAAAAWLARVYDNGLLSGARHERRTTALSAVDTADDAAPALARASHDRARDRSFDDDAEARAAAAVDTLFTQVVPHARCARRGAATQTQLDQTVGWLGAMLLEGASVAQLASSKPLDRDGRPLSDDAISQRLTVTRRRLVHACSALLASGALSPALHDDVVGVIGRMGERRRTRAKT